jgi:hypothetical protein
MAAPVALKVRAFPAELVNTLDYLDQCLIGLDDGVDPSLDLPEVGLPVRQLCLQEPPAKKVMRA